MNRGMPVAIIALISLFFVPIRAYSISYQEEQQPLPSIPFKVIRKIIVEGNKQATSDSILNKLLYKEGRPFDPDKSSDAINNIYSLGSFKQITLAQEPVSPHMIDLIITLEEKKILETT